MPRRDPFTALCRTAAAIANPRYADLHAHTTASDGDLTPSQLVGFAKQAKVLALAITDHDTTAGVLAAQDAGRTMGVEVIAGVEVSARFRNKEVHLLGLFVNIQHTGLQTRLQKVTDRRRERFEDYVSKLPRVVPAHLVEAITQRTVSLGRRHVATLAVQAKLATSRSLAFRNVLDPIRDSVVNKDLVDVEEAIQLIKGAGGISILAHPPIEADKNYFSELKAMGMNGIECKHPSASNTQIDYLKAIAADLQLYVTGGSDSHGNDTAGRKVGDNGINEDEFAALRICTG